MCVKIMLNLYERAGGGAVSFFSIYEMGKLIHVWSSQMHIQ